MISLEVLLAYKRSPVIGNDLVRLRAAQLTDYGAWARLRESSRAHLTRWEPDWTEKDATIDAFRRRIRIQERLRRAGSALALLAFRRDDDELVGGVALSEIRLHASRSAMIGYWTGEAHLRKGFASASVGLMLDYAFNELALNRVEAACQPDNAASRNLLHKAGFREEGVARDFLHINGKWRDHILFAATARDYCGAPPPI